MNRSPAATAKTVISARSSAVTATFSFSMLGSAPPTAVMAARLAQTDSDSSRPLSGPKLFEGRRRLRTGDRLAPLGLGLNLDRRGGLGLRTHGDAPVVPWWGRSLARSRGLVRRGALTEHATSS